VVVCTLAEPAARCLRGQELRDVPLVLPPPNSPSPLLPARTQSSLRAGDVLVKIDDLDASSLEALVKDLLRQSGPTLRLLVQTPGSGKTEPRLVTLELPGPPRDMNADLPVKASGHPEPSVDGVPENGVAAGCCNDTHNPAAELATLMPPSTCEGGGESLAEMRTQLLDCARGAHTLQAQVAALQAELDQKGRECRTAHDLLAAATRQQEMRDAQTAPTAQQAHAREEDEMAAAVQDCEARSVKNPASPAGTRDAWDADKWHGDRETPAVLGSSGAGASSDALLVHASSGALEVQVALRQGQLALHQAELQAARKAEERVAQPAERWAALDALQEDLAEAQQQLAECRNTHETQARQLAEAVFAIESLHLAVFKNGQVPQLCGPGIAVARHKF